MLRNYLKIALRNLLRNKIYSAINIAGLAIGMAACFFIYQYVHFELSYDRFHKNAGRLYRVPISFSGGTDGDHVLAANHPAVGPAMKTDFPEVIDYARVVAPSIFLKTCTMWYTDAQGNTKKFNEDNFYLTDASFLRMFSFPFVSGNPATALDKPSTLVISETVAKKYFGNNDPLNKTVQMNGLPFTITGVFKDVPENSHLKFNMLVSLSLGKRVFGIDNWGWPCFYTYVLLAPGADPKKLEAKFPAFVQRYLSARMKEWNFKVAFSLQPVTDIHLKSNYHTEAEANGSERTVYFMSVLGIFILLIAGINYINLSTSKSLERAMEIGLRKVSGATRRQLSAQFIFESFLVNCMALVMAAVIVILFTPWFNQLTGKKISTVFWSSGILHSWQFWLMLAGVFITIAVLVGAYPAFILSSFKPALVLKGKFQRSDKGLLVRKVLVSCQFILSIILIAGTIIVYRQLLYMRNIDPGYNKDQILIVKAPAMHDSTFNNRVNDFKTELLKNPAITHMAPSSDIPGKAVVGVNNVRRANTDKAHGYTVGLVEIDKDFIPTYQMQLAAGSNLPDYQPGNVFETLNTKMLINEEIVKELGYKSNEAALHQPIAFVSPWGDVNGEIVGVVKNYHQRSLHTSFDPILYYYNSHSEYGYFSIKLFASDVHRNMKYIENLYNQMFPGNAFESFFLDEYFNRQYKADEQFGSIFSVFTVLTIIIACLGLLGLSTFAIKLRTKEIGIRKVLGASVQGIVYLFFSDFVKLVALSAVIAIPVIYLAASKWLNNFAFHIQLNWFIFIASPLLLLLIAFITIGWQSCKAALANPVKALKSE